MPKANLTEIVCILDRSGSMSTMGDEPIGGFNRFVKEQKEVDGDANLTLVLFDDQYDIIHDGINLKKVPELTTEVYFPRGMTALLDAVGKTLTTVKGRLATLEDGERPEKVIVVILTDGLENASVEYRKKGPELKKLIEELQDKTKWEFIFMGSMEEALGEARDLGVQKSSHLRYEASSEGLTSGYASLGRRVAKSRTDGKK